MNSNNNYVYRYYNIDTKETFYIGKGRNKSHLNLYKKNKIFKEYIKNNNCNCVIVMDKLTPDMAHKIKLELIKQYKSIGQCKANVFVHKVNCKSPKDRMSSEKYNQWMHKRIISLTGCGNHNAKKVSVYFPNNIVKNFSYITGAAKYLVDNGYTKTQNVEYVRSAISTAISKNKSYLDCYFYLIIKK